MPKTIIEVNPEDPEVLKKLFELLSEFGFKYKYNDKKCQIVIKGEIDWCKSDFIGLKNIDKDNTEMSFANYNKYSVITFRSFSDNGLLMKEIRIPSPIKFSYFHQFRELVLDLVCFKAK